MPSMNDTQRLADFCETLRRRDSDALGYIPAIAYQEALARGRVAIEYENDEPCGFAFWGRRKRLIRIYQCVIHQDCRRILHATRLVAQTLAQPAAAGAAELALRVGDDLPANHFWQAIGCKLTGSQRGGKRRGRRINLYRLSLGTPAQLARRFIEANLAAQARAIDRNAGK
jgi:hypothetical protein